MMKYYSTSDRSIEVDFKTAVQQSMPKSGGLFMPKNIPTLSGNFIKELSSFSFQEMSYQILYPYVSENITSEALQEIINRALSFEIPLVWLDDSIAVLELFHGPTWAFKDIGARFLAGFIGYFAQSNSKEQHILVATSGDTGGAVAAGFYGVEGVRVTILYPKNKVSEIQQKQLTTWGGNIQAIEIDGSFDDCQYLVKQAFSDLQIAKHSPITSANSINIARLLPQMLYYFRLFQYGVSSDTIVSVPSGNFGNLTAGIFASKMGLPFSHYIAATNINSPIPDFLETSIYQPKMVTRTISNAMDVTEPSNFIRMLDLYKEDEDLLYMQVQGQMVRDTETLETIIWAYEKYKYILDPHTAVGLKALKDQMITGEKGVVLGTAHPVKFDDYISEIRLREHFSQHYRSLEGKPEKKITMKPSYDELKAYLLI